MAKNNTWEIQSKTIDWLRFPLIIMVVFIHCPGHGDIPESVDVWNAALLNSNDYLNLIRMAFTRVIPRIAVPTFFLISGYLFFLRVDTFSKPMYLQKLKKRLHTLLIPYVLWNIIWLTMPIAYHYATGWHNPQHYIDVREYVGSVDWVRWIWDFSFINKYDMVNWLGIVHDSTYPINFPLWYVRDLMVICLLTPIIYWLIKKTGVGFLLVLAFLYIFGVWPNIHGFGLSGLFYFCIGSFFSLRKNSMVDIFRKIEIPCYCVAIVLLCFLIPNNNSYKIGVVNLSVFYVMAGVVSAFNISSRIVSSRKIVLNRWLTNSVFFIYAFHSLIIVRVGVLVIFPYDERTVSLFEYLSTPFITIAICLVVYWLMGKWMPKVLKVLMGNR